MAPPVPRADLKVGTTTTADLKGGTTTTADLKGGTTTTADLKGGTTTTADLKVGTTTTADLKGGTTTTADLKVGTTTTADLIASAKATASLAEAQRRRTLGTTSPGGRLTATGLLIALAGTVLFAWLVWWVGPAEIWSGCRQIGWGLVWILILGGLRFAARAAAWALCIEPPHHLRFADAFGAVICGDALGNVTPLGPIVGEPAKVACVRGRVPVGVALTALAIENLIYTLFVAAMIAAGTIALLFRVELPLQVREISEVAVGGIVVLFGVAAWVLWRRPAVLGRMLPAGRNRSHIDKLRAVEQEIYTFASRRRSVVLPLATLELAFHALGVAEKHLTLWLILGAPPPLLDSFIVETADRLITVVFKFVPYQVGVGEFSTGLMTQLLGLGMEAGVTLSIVRKARMGIWSLVGTALLVRQGLTARKVLEDPELELGVRSQE